MIANKRAAINPQNAKLIKLKSMMLQIEKARIDCGCTACVGSPYGDRLYDYTPCDRALECALEFIDIEN